MLFCPPGFSDRFANYKIARWLGRIVYDGHMKPGHFFRMQPSSGKIEGESITVALTEILLWMILSAGKGEGSGKSLRGAKLLVFFKADDDSVTSGAALAQVQSGFDLLKDRHENGQADDAAERAAENQIAAGADKDPKQKHRKTGKKKSKSQDEMKFVRCAAPAKHRRQQKVSAKDDKDKE